MKSVSYTAADATVQYKTAQERAIFHLLKRALERSPDPVLVLCALLGEEAFDCSFLWTVRDHRRRHKDPPCTHRRTPGRLWSARSTRQASSTFADLARRRRRGEWATLRTDNDVGMAAGAYSRHHRLTAPGRVDVESRCAFAAQGQAGEHHSRCRSASVRVAGESQQGTVAKLGRR
jgi:hypothetical protein